MSSGTTEGVLPDGSMWRVEPIGVSSSLISRLVDGRTLWGQCFSRNVDHDGQVLEVLAHMELHPDSFCYWWNVPIGCSVVCCVCTETYTVDDPDDDGRCQDCVGAGRHLVAR